VPAHRPQDDRGREAKAAGRPSGGHGQRSLSDGRRRERRSYPLAGRRSPRQSLRLPPTSCWPAAPNRGFLAAVRARPRGTGVYPLQRPKVFSIGRGGVGEIRKVSARKGRHRFSRRGTPEIEPAYPKPLIYVHFSLNRLRVGAAPAAEPPHLDQRAGVSVQVAQEAAAG
jgi:hypothetical protein